jgi:hypothetical protein
MASSPVDIMVGSASSGYSIRGAMASCESPHLPAPPHLHACADPPPDRRSQMYETEVPRSFRDKYMPSGDEESRPADTDDDVDDGAWARPRAADADADADGLLFTDDAPLGRTGFPAVRGDDAAATPRPMSEVTPLLHRTASMAHVRADLVGAPHETHAGPSAAAPSTDAVPAPRGKSTFGQTVRVLPPAVRWRRLAHWPRSCSTL